MKSFLSFALTALVISLSVSSHTYAQADLAQASYLMQAPATYRILSINVEGVADENTQSLVIRQSGLAVGQEVVLPHDEVFGKAIRQLYRFGLFSDVKIVIERIVGDELYLAIRLREEPRLKDYTFTGIKGGHRDDLRRLVPLLKGQAVRSGDVERSITAIKKFYTEKGHPLATVDVKREVGEDNRLLLSFVVNRGQKVEVEKIIIRGNKAMSTGKVASKLKETKEDRWWRFWRGEKFDRDKFEEDLQNVIAYYNEKGYYDARILRDTSYVVVDDGGAGVHVEIDLHEGPQYFIRNISWEGNTAFSDQQLSAALGFKSGDIFNTKRFDTNLYANSQSTDVASLYYNIGFVRFNVVPTISEVAEDSLDLAFEIFEGDTYEFGDINVTGNTKTKDHVVLRQLRTIPGNTFSRDAIQRSLRELAQLGYFNPESLIPETRIDPDRKVVDVTYQVEETGGDQLELSGGWGGFGGVLLQAGVTFNNFSIQNVFKGSAWQPLPSGDGQKLSLSVQVQGLSYQSYGVSFQEPWFRGKPHPVGVSLSHTRYNLSTRLLGGTRVVTDPDNNLSITSASVSYGRALKWPDDYFQTSSSVGYRLYRGGSVTSTFGLPPGTNQALTFTQRLSRNSLNDPTFPSSGSAAMASLEVAPPLPSFIQYHKWTFDTSWNLPLSPSFSLGVGAQYGYIGSLEDNKPVQFERYLVGGTPFDAQYGRVGFGKDIIYTRGYPSGAIGLRDQNNVSAGGTILNKYTSEIRWHTVRNPQLAVQMFGFLDAVNTWDGWDNYNPNNLYRAGGFGVRVFLPILGMMNLNYGYNFDRFPAVPGDDTGEKKWRFQFSLGQAF